MYRQRFFALVAALTLVVALLPGTGQVVLAGPGLTKDPSQFTATSLTPDSTFVGSKSPTSNIATTDPTLLGRTDATPINVLIKYDYDATASYEGGVAGLAATSPAVTGKKLKDNQNDVQNYEEHTRQVSEKTSAAVASAVPSVKIAQSFQTVYGGVAAQVPANAVADLLKVSGVVAVQNDNLEQPLSDATQFIGATAVWPTLGGQDQAASNVIVGIIDTGIWPEHPSFANHDLPPAPVPPSGSYGCQFGDGTDTAHLGPTFTCNRKLIGAYAFTNTYMALIGAIPGEFCNNATKKCSARDPEGHGTHTSSTAAGDRVDSAMLYGVERGPVSGVAPGARVIMYRVCLAQGCFNSDSVAAVQQGIKDDIDVINYSISGGGNPYTDAVELAFLDAFHAGISVNASAGNSGPSARTVDHGGPWVTTVGASTSNRFFTSTLHLTAGTATFDMPGVTVTNGIVSATPVVLAESITGEDSRCQTQLAAGTATGKIVACRRGINARVDKGFNVAAGGAAGMILYNFGRQDVETDNHWLPAIHVDGPSTALLAFITGHTNVTATWAQGTETATQGDVMAAFSSRGPQADFIKPDITAPGIQVLAGMTPQPTGITNGPAGNLYQAIAGTSMSSPHAAGASALIKAAHPSWTPAMIKSALMTSAAQTAVKEDGVTPADPFDVGSGALRVNLAVNPTVVFDETFANFTLSAGDPLHRIDLNLPSVNASTMTGTITTKRTLKNVTGEDQTLRVAIQSPTGASIFVSDSAPERGRLRTSREIEVQAGRSTTIWITMSGPALANGQYFGRITLTPSGDKNHDEGNGSSARRATNSPVTIPVALNRKQGVVSLTNSCTPTTFTTAGSTQCSARVANFSSAEANVALTVTNPGGGLTFANVAAPATLSRNTIQWSGTLSPAIPPQVTSIALGVGPFGGYLPLSAFGIPPTAGVGDDTISNFNVPTFFYGGEPYTRVGVVSNGYLVIGGGTGADVVFPVQTFPNPARPNNTLAPFWTDLNPPAGGAIRVATLTDGSTTWLVIDYDGVRNFTGVVTHTFEVTIRVAGGAAGTGAASEQITMSYDTTGAGDPGSGVNWGAENRDGTSGKNIRAPGPANGTEYIVTLTPPTAGGSQTVTYDASAKKAGTFTSLASMTSNVTPGTTQVVQTLTVTKQ